MSDNQDSVFNEDTTDTESTSFLDQFVGDGKKFKSPEDLARGKAESDRYIEELKAELERTKQSAESKLDELLRKIGDRSTTSTSGQTQSTQTNSTGSSTEVNKTSSDVAGKDIKSLVEEALKEQQNMTRREANLQVVNEQMAEWFGEKSNVVVREKAKEMGLGVKDLEEMAAKSPTAFLKLVQEEGKTPTVASRVNNAVNSEALGVTNPNKSGERGWSFYRDLKKKNPSEFWKRHFEIHDMVEKMGADRFYNS